MGTAIADLTDFTVSVLDEMDTPAFPAQGVLSVLRPAVDAASAVYQRTNWRTGETRIVPSGWMPPDITPLLQASRLRREEHPLMVAAAHGRLAPSTAERTVGAAEWLRSPVRAFLVDLGGWEQMASVGLQGGPAEIVGLAFARPGADFGDDDLALLGSVQPLLQALDRHATRLQRWRDELEETTGSAGGTAGARDAGLTGREVSVLLLLARGHTATAMARRLGCSPRTVEKHTGSLYRKLGARDRLTAVLEAQYRGLLPAGPPGGDRAPGATPHPAGRPG